MTIAPINGVIRLNVGCGEAPQPDWWNVDASPDVERECIRRGWPFIRALADLLPLDSDTADVLYASHLLEHFPSEPVDGLPSADMVMREWVRVLKPGGRLFVAVPDMRAIAAELGAARDDEAGWLQDIYGFPRPGMRHYYGYSAATLSHLLRRHGLGATGFFDPFLRRLDGNFDAAWSHRTNATGSRVETSLNLCAIKPQRAI